MPHRVWMRQEIRFKVNSVMLLTEFFNSAKTEQYKEKDDQSTLKLDDTRKVRLTLLHLNRLRSANDVRKFENEQKAEELTDQYKAASGGDDAAL